MDVSIEITQKTKNALDQILSNESYDLIISKLLKLVPKGDDERFGEQQFQPSVPYKSN